MKMNDPGPATPQPERSRTSLGEVAGLLARGALLIAALGFVFLAVRGGQRPLEEGQPAPPLPLVSYDGQGWDLTRFAGKPVVVNFWGTWCPPCLQEMPHFALAARGYGDQLVFIGASVNSPRNDVFRVIERFGIPYPIAQVDAATSASWNARSLPSTYLLDAQHRVVWSASGALTRKALEDVVEEHLGIAPPGR